MKLAKGIPIFKSGVKQDISKYHLINFNDANKILYKYQFGFPKSHSTNHAIISLVEKVNNAMDSGKISIGVFLDLRKAFDTVDHCILLDKLYKYGIRGTLWSWFKSYLENRKQYVCLILYLQLCQSHMLLLFAFQAMFISIWVSRLEIAEFPDSVRRSAP